MQPHARAAVVIAAYNSEATLPRALASLEKNAEPHDVFIVDDCSRLPVETALRRRGPNVRIIRLESNVGVTRATNIALREILKGGYEFVAILDADDVAASERLVRQVAYLDGHPQVMALATWANLIDSDGRKIHESRPPQSVRALRKALRTRNPIVHSSVIFRSTVFAGGKLYDETFDTSQDYEILCRIAASSDIGVIPEILTDYFVNLSSISSKRRGTMLWNSLRVRLRYFDAFQLDSYWGVLRLLPLALLPRRLSLSLRSATDYLRWRRRRAD